MKKMGLIVSILSTIILAGIMAGCAPGAASSQPGATETASQSALEGALATTLTGYTHWQTVQGEAEFTWYGKDGKPENVINKFALSLPDKARVDTIVNSNADADKMWISDGQNIYEVSTKAKTYAQRTFPKEQMDSDMSKLPTRLNQLHPDGIITHPLTKMIIAPIGKYIFPTWFPGARIGDNFTITQETTFLNRKVWVIAVHTIDKQDSSAWVDQQTGIILKYDQAVNGKKFLEMQFTSFNVDGKISPEVFNLPSGYSLK